MEADDEADLLLAAVVVAGVFVGGGVPARGGAALLGRGRGRWLLLQLLEAEAALLEVEERGAALLLPLPAARGRRRHHRGRRRLLLLAHCPPGEYTALFFKTLDHLPPLSLSSLPSPLRVAVDRNVEGLIILWTRL